MRISELERKTYSKADYQPIRRCLNCGRDIPDITWAPVPD
jgi:hypothetical protein